MIIALKKQLGRGMLQYARMLGLGTVTASFLLTPALSPAISVDYVTNGNFENGLTGWTHSGTVSSTAVFGGGAHSGNYVGEFCTINSNDVTGEAYQSISPPSTTAVYQVSFWYKISTQEGTDAAYDTLTVRVVNANTLADVAPVATISNLDQFAGSTWQQITKQFTNPLGVPLRLVIHAQTDVSLPTYFLIDDISVTVYSTVTAPSNDNFANGRAIYESGYDISGNVGATAESGEPAHAGNTARHSVWWNYTTNRPGTLTVSTQNSIESAIAVYTGSVVSSLTPITSSYRPISSGGSIMSLVVLPGPTYHIAFDGYNGATSDVDGIFYNFVEDSSAGATATGNQSVNVSSTHTYLVVTDDLANNWVVVSSALTGLNNVPITLNTGNYGLALVYDTYFGRYTSYYVTGIVLM